MATTVKYIQGVQSTLLSTELNALPNNVAATGAAFDNATNLYLGAEIELVSIFGTAPTASTACSVWFLRNLGNGYEDGTSGITPARLPDVVIPLRAVTTTQRVVRECLIPPGNTIPLLKNDGTGQTLTSGVLNVRPFSYQNV